MKSIAVLAGAVALALSAPAAAWGPTGHRITATIAEDNISGQTRAHVREILGSETLAEASTWPDEQKSNPAPYWQQTATPWHWVTLPQGKTAAQLVHPPEGDAVTALDHFTEVLRDPAASRADKAAALRWVVHLVGDLHMPFHVGREGDHGANDIKVTWFGQPDNLHSVWDDGILDHSKLSYSEYAARLEGRMTPAQVLLWWDPRPNTWIDESAALRERIYPKTGPDVGLGTAESPIKLGYDYEYAWKPSLELRLEQAGIRIAAYLDWVFAGQP